MVARAGKVWLLLPDVTRLDAPAVTDDAGSTGRGRAHAVLSEQNGSPFLQRRAVRIALLSLTGIFLVLGAYSAIFLVTDSHHDSMRAGDYAIYRDAAARWLGGGFYYYPEQITGPYYAAAGHVLYPPPSLVLFVPFVFLPAVLWWAIPLAITTWRLHELRPARWSWPLLAAGLAWPVTVELIFTGNPVLWVVASLALATRWPWVSILVFLKPSLFPFALFGVRTRGWWMAAAALAVISLAFLPLWPQWIAAILNARGPASGILYSVHDLPGMSIPLVAWWARRDR